MAVSLKQPRLLTQANFNKIQEQFPDALKLTIHLFPGDSFTDAQLISFLGGGKLLFSSIKGRKQTIIVSKLAAARIMVIYGPPASGKTRAAQKYGELFAPDVMHVRYNDLLPIPETVKCVVIDEWPACVNISDASNLFNVDGKEVTPQQVIITVQTRPNFIFKPREGVFFIRKQQSTN